MDEEQKKQGAWQTEHNRLEVEIAQRLHRLRMEGVLETPRQLDDWLSGPKDRLFQKLGFDEAKTQ